MEFVFLAFDTGFDHDLLWPIEHIQSDIVLIQADTSGGCVALTLPHCHVNKPGLAWGMMRHTQKAEPGERSWGHPNPSSFQPPQHLTIDSWVSPDETRTAHWVQPKWMAPLVKISWPYVRICFRAQYSVLDVCHYDSNILFWFLLLFYSKFSNQEIGVFQLYFFWKIFWIFRVLWDFIWLLGWVFVFLQRNTTEILI